VTGDPSEPRVSAITSEIARGVDALTVGAVVNTKKTFIDVSLASIAFVSCSTTITNKRTHGVDTDPAIDAVVGPQDTFIQV
jgi:hypothetical protein